VIHYQDESKELKDDRSFSPLALYSYLDDGSRSVIRNDDSKICMQSNPKIIEIKIIMDYGNLILLT
jgi:hypothetical protein